MLLCLEPPSFVQKPDPMDVLTGTNVTFTSIVKGTPPFSVSWFKGSSELVPGDRCNVSLEDSVAELELFDVDTSQSGEYTCIVSNEAGKASCTTHLYIKGLSDCSSRFIRLVIRCVYVCMYMCLILYFQLGHFSPSQICEEAE